MTAAQLAAAGSATPLSPLRLRWPSVRTQRWWLMLAAIFLVMAVMLQMLTTWHDGFRVVTWAGDGMLRNLRFQCFRHVSPLGLSFHGSHPSGEWFSYLFGLPSGQVLGFHQMGVVPQDPFIFRATFRAAVRATNRENVRVAQPAADERANCGEFISRMDHGLDTPVGEGGWTRSGGPRQRLVTARVLLAESVFLMFDEATSAFDTLSEELIQNTLENGPSGRTARLIAQRLATAKNVDRITVLRDGRLEQDDSYDALMAQPELFRQSVEGQQLHG